MTIVLCLPGNNFSGKFVDCLVETINFFHSKKWRFGVSRRESNNIYYVRSLCLGADVLKGKNQKPFDGQIDYDYQVWIDSDMVWSPEQIEELLKTEGDIVSGMYKTQNGVHYATTKTLDVDFLKANGYYPFMTYEDLQKEENQDPFNVEYTGMGFMAIKKGVIENLEYPWFEPIFQEIGDDVVDFSGDDAGFCIKAKRKGYNITVNPKIIVGHEKRVVL